MDVAEVSMYDRAGSIAIRLWADELCQRAFADPMLAPWFGHLSVERRGRLKRNLALMIGQALGGPVIFSIEYLGRIHHNLPVPITDAAYSQVVGHMVVVLVQCLAPDDIINHLSRVVEDLRGLIVSIPE